MITVKDFQIKTIQDLVEKELFKILDEGDFPFKHSFYLKSSYAGYQDEIIEELKRRGFTNVRTNEDSYWIGFEFDVDMEKKEEKKEIVCCPFCKNHNYGV